MAEKKHPYVFNVGRPVGSLQVGTQIEDWCIHDRLKDFPVFTLHHLSNKEKVVVGAAHNEDTRLVELFSMNHAGQPAEDEEIEEFQVLDTVGLN